MKNKYTATIYIKNYEGDYEEKSDDDLAVLIAWGNEQAKNMDFDIEMEIVDNDNNKIIDKRSLSNQKRTYDSILLK